MKSKSYHNGSFPRTFDKHEPPEIEEKENIKHFNNKKTVRLIWYVKKPLTGIRKMIMEKTRMRLFRYVTIDNKMIVEERKRKFKNRRAALDSIQSEKDRCKYFGYEFVNYRIEEL